MVTIRQLAACLGVFGPVVSVRPLFAAKSPPLSVLALISKAMQRKVDLNIIRVGAESFTAQDEFEIFAALKVLEVLYSTVDLGIGKTEHFGIPLDEANGHEDIDSLDEATALEDEFGFSGKAVDIFLVQTFAGPVVGRSPIGGACKGADEPDSGLVVAIEESPDITANTLAHELAHYLGLLHVADPDNLMFKNVPNGGKLTAEQGKTMKQHCIVRTGCRPK